MALGLALCLYRWPDPQHHGHHQWSIANRSGVGLFVIAAWLSSGETGERNFALLFGGLGIATFLAFFISRPLAALEENLLLITRLGVIYNIYWTRLLYMQDTATVQADLEDATMDAITELDKLTDKSTELAQNRPGLGVR